MNATIVRLNAENCRLVGSTSGPPTLTIPLGANPGSYQHFVVGNQSYKSETPERKAINFKAKRSSLKYVGDAALRIIFEELKKYVPVEILEIYRTILNRLDVTKLAEIFAAAKASLVKVSQLRKVYFKVFLESLDIIELVDCVVENAGRPQEEKTVVTSPAFDDDGNPAEEVERTITSQSSLDFELELKTILYSKFSYFYNIAKEFDSQLFDFPTSDDKLPNVKDLVDAREAAGQKLLDDGPDGGIQIKSQIETKKKLLEQLNKPNSVNKNLIPEVTEDLIAKETELAALEQALVDAQANLQDVVEKNFMYVLMIPESQMSSIYNTIVHNDPQYKYKPELINAGMLEARDTPGFSPPLFIEILFKNEILKFALGLEEDLFVDFYDNIAQQNKKLKTNEELKKDFENGSSQEDIGKLAKTSQISKPKVPTFDIHSIRYPTFSLDALLRPLLKKALDEAMKAALTPLVNASKVAMDNSFNGDEDAFNRLDPDLKAEYTANDLVQNATDGTQSSIASPLEIYLKVQAEVFPLNTVEEIERLFDKLQDKFTAAEQLKLMSNTLDEEDTIIDSAKNIFASCGINNTFNTITNFFVWLRDFLNSTGGLDLLLQKIEEARIASLINTDLCDDNFEFLDDLLKSNDSQAAIRALEEVLGSLNDKKINSSMPDVFGCSDNTGKDSIFPDFYNGQTRDSQDKHVKGMITGINNVFNNDIAKFKSIILEQDKNGEQILSNFFGGTLNQQKKTLQDFERNKNKMVNGENVPIETRNEYKSKQKDLRKILTDVLNASPPELFQINTGVEGLIVYKFNFFDSYIYEIVINQNDNEETYRDETLDPNSGYIFFSKIEGDDSVEIILFEKVFAAIDGIADPVQMYATLINLYNPLSFAIPGALYKNQILQVDYPGITADGTPDGQKPFQYYSQKLLNFLYAKDAAEDDANFPKGNKRLLEVLLDSLTTSFVNEASIFDNENFNNIPLQDLENPDYVDNGILMTDEVFKKYQDLRKEYQCFLTFDGSQDAHLLSNLKALYKLLFNCLIIESLMAQFFTLGQEQLSFANSSTVKNAVLLGIDESFTKSITKIGNLETDHTSDIDLLYKFEVLEKKRAAGSNLEEPLDADGNSEWQYTNTDDKTNYLASEYYDKIINRLQNRIETAVPDFQLSGAGALSNLSNIFIKKPNGGTLFDMYDTVDYSDDEKVIPVLNGLRKGLILQKFVDVRQNGSIMTDFKNGILPGGTPSKYADAVSPFAMGAAKMSLAKDLNSNYLPYLRGDVFEVDTTDTAISLLDLEQNLKFPGYPNAFFTGKSSTGDGYNSPTFASAAPKLTTFAIGDIDSLAQYAAATPPYERKWYNNFYETQGKISDFSYALSYGATGQSGIDIFDQTLAPYLIKNGPSAYYKKASAGVRLCMALSLDMNSDKLGTDWNNILDNHGPQGNPIAKEIYKEKFGLYKNELGQQFILIPLIERGEDYLKIAQDEWEESDSINWWKNLYTNITSHDFTDNKSLITEIFTGTYPYTTNIGQAIPITVQTLINLQYDNKLSNMFGLTKEEILRAIKTVKAVSNGEWNLNVEAMIAPGMDMNVALAFSLIPILIKLLATFVDPTWNTPWFLPGPIGPIGYIAKILDAAD